MFDYLDTSAAVKLMVADPESDELRHYVTEPSRRLVTSDLTRTELVRAVRRIDPGLAVAARELLDSLTIMTLTTDVFERATLLEPPTMRSLDALHLAAALTLGDELDAVITYDDRLADAVRAAAMTTVAPGRT
ncbi:hypothetical protein BDK89_0178 [Ilumatobacter fluminis]|uniref:Ribonuclease VapC n=1 Tax=Ilumatobacter fluminis TaxID=467091 RepID=A0A4R7HWT9_9ACTN|nr:type II toxin-antitoxin system VapC family toxin [Ilumatobacter fluminis]TDT14623.1 hypothetical protein BDK89_0178 [Ilumatobacter fluminis]